MKKYALISFAVFIFSILFSLSSPPLGTLNSEVKNDNNNHISMTDSEILNKALMKNYNAFENFSARYKNTVLNWFGKSRNLNEFYIPQETIDSLKPHLKSYFIDFGKILPYLLLTFCVPYHYLFLTFSIVYMNNRLTTAFYQTLVTLYVLILLMYETPLAMCVMF